MIPMKAGEDVNQTQPAKKCNLFLQEIAETPPIRLRSAEAVAR